MKALMLFLWGIVLFIFTCAADSSFWSKGAMPYFHLTPSPDFRNLLQMDIRYTEIFITRKIGHFVGFAIFGMLLYRINKSYIQSIVWSILFAVSTEIFQLYFGRDGRIYDMVNDSAGIVTGIILIAVVKRWNRAAGLQSRRR
ncbi:VanZ family protein [Paenibacillus sp. FSL R7-0331]|uniref:VanZ family protein n=1 Tax=Paenibacillus sp. FSL R7-0331 TaxID=1536773 RepID=UPI000693CA19|nr:VanZ family protein [Paenibacillus sp. FSL R7-0331]